MLIAALIILLILISFALIFFFRKIINQNVIEATKHLDELSHDYDEKQKKIDSEMQETRLKAQEIIDRAQEEVKKQKMEIIQSAEKEKDKAITDARSRAEEIIQQAEKSRYQLLAELDKRIEKESVKKACELIGQVLPEQFKKDVHLHWTQELLKDSLSQLEQVRIPEDAQQVKIASAFPLDEEQRQILFKKLKNKLGKDIPFKEEVDPKIVAGFVISVGSLLIDGSLKNRIEERAQSVQYSGNE
jgi:F0F1-type ATP synthase delta subunit